MDYASSPHPITPPSARLVLVHLDPPRDPATPRPSATPTTRTLGVSFYIMSGDAFRCPTHSPAMEERVGGLFQPCEACVISEDQDGECDGDGDGDEANADGGGDGQQDDDGAAAAQEYIEQYMAQVRQAYQRCFAKAVYTHLRSSGRAAPQDIAQCLDIMLESHVDLDLSEFVQVLASPKARAAAPFSAVQEQFAAKVARSFSRVPLPSIPYFYYHRPSKREDTAPANGNGYAHDDGDDSESETNGYEEGEDMEYDPPVPEGSNTSSALELCPIFIGETEGDIHSKDAMGMYSLPLLMRMEVLRGERGGDTTTEVVTNLPVPSADPSQTITLRFVCLVLPPLLCPARLVHEGICQVIHAHKKRITTLLSTEILSALLSVHPPTDSMLGIVARHLAALPSTPSHAPAGCHVHRAAFEVSFVDRREGNKLFTQELKESKPSLSTTPSHPALVRLSKDLYVLATAPRTQDGQFDPVGYWLLLECQMDSVVATLFSLPPHQRGDASIGNGVEAENSEADKEGKLAEHLCEGTWEKVREGIAAVSRRVNQLILLYHLHESRICSDLLLPSDSPPPAQNFERTQQDKKGDGKGRGGVTSFRPGEFECPLVHTITLSLHDRLPPANAVRALILSALHPFAIANRKTLFVYHEKNGGIFYICLHASSNTQSSTAPSEASPPPLSLSSSPTPSQACITLNVYGVDPAGSEITQHLHQLLENKLSSSTLAYLSNLFLRNPLLKLTTEDLDFLRPTASFELQTPQSVVIETPAFVDDLYLFLLFLKYNLMQFLNQMHLSPAAQQREDAGVAQQREGACAGTGASAAQQSEGADAPQREDAKSPTTGDCLEIRPSEFMLMYNHVASPTSTLPYTAIGQGMACIALCLLDAQGARKTTTPRSTTHSSYTWALEGLHVKLIDTSSSSLPPAGSRILLRVWSRGAINVPVLIDYLVLCANQTICEYVLETSLLPSSNIVTLDTLPEFVRTTEAVLARTHSLSTSSVFEHTLAFSLPSWATHSFLADLRDAMADTNAARPFAYSCEADANGVLRCSLCQSTSTHSRRISMDVSGMTAGGRPGNGDDDCTCSTSASDFYHYDNEDAEPNSANTDLATSMMALRTQPQGFFFILGGKRVTLTAPSKQLQPEQHAGAHFYPAIKDSQFPEPLLRHCVAIARLDMPHANEQGCKVTIRIYNWDQSKRDYFTSLCARLVASHTLRQHLLGTILHQKLGLFQHQPALPPSASMPGGQTPSRITWDNVDAVLPPTLARRRTTSAGVPDTEKHKEEQDKDNEKLSDPDAKKPRPEPLSFRPPRPTLEFDSVFRFHYPLISIPLGPVGLYDPPFQHVSQSRALASHIEQRASQRQAALGSISILPTPTSGTPSSPLTPSQLEAVIAIARLVHFRCVPFLFGVELVSFGPTQPSTPPLPMLDAFVHDYIDYLSGFGVVPLLVESAATSPPTATKRVSTRAYLQKVFLDGTLLVKISFRVASVACEFFAVPQLNSPHPPAHSQFPHTPHPPPSPHFGEQLTEFTHKLHLNSFTYDFHVNQLFRMIKYPSPSIPSTMASILQALHQYYPSPPLHVSTCLESSFITCHLSRLSPEGPEITTNQVLEFMMLDENCTSNSISPLRHIGISPALLLCTPPPPHSSYSDMCTVICSRQAILDLEQQDECGCASSITQPGDGHVEDGESHHHDGQAPTDTLSLHLFVIKVGEFCVTNPSRLHTPCSNAHVIAVLRKAIATSGINYQRDQLWTKLLRANPYAPALTYDEFHTLMRLVHTRPATQLDPILTQPVNLLRLGPGVWSQLHGQIRQVNMERSRQVFMDPARHLLVFHPTNNTQLVHFTWHENGPDATVSLCRLDERSLGDETSDRDEMEHFSHLVNIACHCLWRHVILK